MSQSEHGASGRREKKAMTHGFQQQDEALTFCIPKSAATPQHGQKADKAKAVPAREPRTFEPRPGH